jgi:hypothetical protein
MAIKHPKKRYAQHQEKRRACCNCDNATNHARSNNGYAKKRCHQP